MVEANGVGFARNASWRPPPRVVFQNEDEDVLAIVKPYIVELGKETEVAEEGCLSIQGITVPVERALEVTVVGKVRDRRRPPLMSRRLFARCVQHETRRHLDAC